ncbi:DUF3089 domain-containing protein [Aurantimonas aggregata]|uniref:DUF3089 domain-containing protein n=1 Tax=Aurantimonas aggregata TaxID=2047720 RepID=A0A6L9MBX8_9HYPH|nr:DUF3089 domain-containing protein [Aurantimonas aggregata]NDV85364.1 DUF3089 domain-containing protein [Aurantimonas aggregata]
MHSFIDGGAARSGPILFAAAILAFLAIQTSSRALATGEERLPPAAQAVIPSAPDYDDEDSWLAIPDDPDRFAVDVIWVYPSVLTDQSAWLMDISRQDLVEAAAETVATEARVFSGQANLYAPLYRQMNLAGFGLEDGARAKLVAEGADDVGRAMRNYMAHHNKGRPFILAGHSQGSYVLTELLVQNWGRLGIEDQLVAGYLIGWSITDEDLRANPAMTICDTPDQTGCFVSYNSVAPGKQGKAPMILPGAVVVNPLTWTRNTGLAPASANLGSTFFNPDGTSDTLPGFASAEIADGGLAVVVKDPNRVKQSFFPAGVYHGYDYALFFENLRSNAAQRIQSILAAPPSSP